MPVHVPKLESTPGVKLCSICIHQALICSAAIFLSGLSVKTPLGATGSMLLQFFVSIPFRVMTPTARINALDFSNMNTMSDLKVQTCVSLAQLRIRGRKSSFRTTVCLVKLLVSSRTAMSCLCTGAEPRPLKCGPCSQHKHDNAHNIHTHQTAVPVVPRQARHLPKTVLAQACL